MLCDSTNYLGCIKQIMQQLERRKMRVHEINKAKARKGMIGAKKKWKEISWKVLESAASCVEQFSYLKHYFTKVTVQIKDQWVENNISKFQLNPTVNEVTMTVLQKGVCAVSPRSNFQQRRDRESTQLRPQATQLRELAACNIIKRFFSHHFWYQTSFPSIPFDP